jgi:hypothetical protein
MVVGKTGPLYPVPIKLLVSLQMIIGEVVLPGDFLN